MELHLTLLMEPPQLIHFMMMNCPHLMLVLHMNPHQLKHLMEPPQQQLQPQLMVVHLTQLMEPPLLSL